MIIETEIKKKILAAFNPCYLQLINQSAQHGAGAAESHFKVVVVSSRFNDQTRLQRHRAVYQVLEQELAGEVHALALHTYSESEWGNQPGIVPPQSPTCSGMRS